MLAMGINPERIESAMKARKMTPDDLAFEIRRLSGGVSRTTGRQVHAWMRGRHEPRASVMQLIAQATGQTLDYFYGTDGEPEGDDEEPG